MEASVPRLLALRGLLLLPSPLAGILVQTPPSSVSSAPDFHPRGPDARLPLRAAALAHSVLEQAQRRGCWSPQPGVHALTSPFRSLGLRSSMMLQTHLPFLFPSPGNDISPGSLETEAHIGGRPSRPASGLRVWGGCLVAAAVGSSQWTEPGKRRGVLTRGGVCVGFVVNRCGT